MILNVIWQFTDSGELNLNDADFGSVLHVESTSAIQP